MKLKVLLDPSDSIFEELEKLGIGLDDNSEYILTKRNMNLNYIPARREEQIFYIPVKEIIYIESLKQEVVIHAADGIYGTRDRLKQFEKMLDSDEFLRISNSIIVSVSHIKRIEALMSQKFLLYLSDGNKVDVTRSYYYIFKDRFNI